jgi:hypothetical protein
MIQLHGKGFLLLFDDQSHLSFIERQIKFGKELGLRLLEPTDAHRTDSLFAFICVHLSGLLYKICKVGDLFWNQANDYTLDKE